MDIEYKDKLGNPLSVGGLTGKEAWEQLYSPGSWVSQAPEEGDYYKIVELWDSGPQAGMDCQVYVEGGYPAGTKAVCENGGTTDGSIKSDDMQEVLFWACYAPPNHGAYNVYLGGVNCETLVDTGWLCDTNHRHPQRIVYRLVEGNGGTPEPPPEPPPDLAELYEQANLVVELLEGALVEAQKTVMMIEDLME